MRNKKIPGHPPPPSPHLLPAQNTSLRPPRSFYIRAYTPPPPPTRQILSYLPPTPTCPSLVRQKENKKNYHPPRRTNFIQPSTKAPLPLYHNHYYTLPEYRSFICANIYSKCISSTDHTQLTEHPSLPMLLQRTSTTIHRHHTLPPMGPCQTPW